MIHLHQALDKEPTKKAIGGMLNHGHLYRNVSALSSSQVRSRKVSCNNGRVRTHQSTSEAAVRRLGRMIQRFFCPIRSQHSPSRLEMVWWGSVLRGSFTPPCKLSWNLSLRRFIFLAPWLTAPGSPRMALSSNWKNRFVINGFAGS